MGRYCAPARGKCSSEIQHVTQFIRFLYKLIEFAQISFRLPHLRMAVHDDLGCGEIGKRTLFDGRVTVTAIKTQSSNVMRVTERNCRLLVSKIRFD